VFGSGTPGTNNGNGSTEGRGMFTKMQMKPNPEGKSFQSSIDSLSIAKIEDATNIFSSVLANSLTGQNNDFFSGFGALSSTLGKSLTSTGNVMDNFKNMQGSMNAINSIMNNTSFFKHGGPDALINAAINNQQASMQEMKESLAENRAITAEMQTVVDGFANEADRLTALLGDLDQQIDPEAADIVSLLRQFREIISDLDIKTRELNQIVSNRNKLDRKFLNLLKENRERWDNLDEAKRILVKAFNNSREVSESSMTGDAKLALNDIKGFLKSMIAMVQEYKASAAA
jgi:hypothetical protein